MNAHEPSVRYAGVAFRTETEARWAVFLDHLGVRWHYELRLPGTGEDLLTPDFWLPELRTFLKIQDASFVPWAIRAGETRDALLTAACRDLSARNQGRFVMLIGSPGEHWLRYGTGVPTGVLFDADGGTDEPFCWCICPTCQKAGIEWRGYGARICRHDSNDKGCTADDQALVVAYQAAEKRGFK